MKISLREAVFVLAAPYLFVCFYQPIAVADTVFFTNGDILSGTVIEHGPNQVLLESEVLGTVSIERNLVREMKVDELVVTAEVDDEGKLIWTREVSAGLNRMRGNTEQTTLSGEIFLNRQVVKRNEFTFRWKSDYSESNRKMNSRKHYGVARAAFSFGASKRFYEFNKIEADHNRFANIDLRLVPAVGIGFWLLTHEKLKALFEVAVGAERTDFREGKTAETEGTLIPRFQGEVTWFGKLKLSEELTSYLSMTGFPDYRLRSETLLELPLLERLSARFRIIDEYNSAPGKNSKRNDLRLESSIAYSF